MFDNIWNRQSYLMSWYTGDRTLLPLLILEVILETAEATNALIVKNFEDYETRIIQVYKNLINVMVALKIPRQEIFFHENQDLEELFLDVEGDFDEVFIREYSTPSTQYIKEAAYEMIEKLCLAINHLEDAGKGDLSAMLGEIHYDFIIVCYLSGITARDLYEGYMEMTDDKR